MLRGRVQAPRAAVKCGIKWLLIPWLCAGAFTSQMVHSTRQIRNGKRELTRLVPDAPVALGPFPRMVVHQFHCRKQTTKKHRTYIMLAPQVLCMAEWAQFLGAQVTTSFKACFIAFVPVASAVATAREAAGVPSPSSLTMQGTWRNCVPPAPPHWNTHTAESASPLPPSIAGSTLKPSAGSSASAAALAGAAPPSRSVSLKGGPATCCQRCANTGAGTSTGGGAQNLVATSGRSRLRLSTCPVPGTE